MLQAELEKAEDRAKDKESKNAQLEEELKEFGHNVNTLKVWKYPFLFFENSLKRLPILNTNLFCAMKVFIFKLLIHIQNQESKASDMEESYSEQVKTLKSKYEEESSRAENAERSVRKLEKDIENLEDELERERNKSKNLEEEMKSIMSDLNSI